MSTQLPDPPPETEPTTEWTTVGTLGSEGTFAGQAAGHLGDRHARWAPPRFYPSMDDVWEACTTGEVDVAILGADSTRVGPGQTMRRIVTSDLVVYVLAELVVPYRCRLLARPMTELSDVRTVLGHGSVKQCRPFLESTLPEAEVHILHELSSTAAAERVHDGDGTLAVVGTRRTAEQFGLVELATDIDGGAEGLWWAMSRTPRPHPEPQRLLIRARFRADGKFGQLADSLSRLGYDLECVHAQPSQQMMRERDYLLEFGGPGEKLGKVEQSLQKFPVATLIGALPALEWIAS